MAEAYRAAVELSLAGNVRQGLAAIMTSMTKMVALQGRITKGFENWKVALGGVMLAIGGAEGLKSLMTLAQHSRKLLDEQNKLITAGVKLNDVLELQADYYNRVAKEIPTATSAEYLKVIGEMRSITGTGPEGLANAAKVTEKALQVDALLANTAGRTSDEEKGQSEFYKLLRSAEMKAIATNPQKLDQFIDIATKMIMAFGGKLSANDFQTLARRGGTAWMHTDIAKTMVPIGTLAADIGGPAAGQALQSMYQFQQGAGVLSNTQGEMLIASGLVNRDDLSPIAFNKYRLKPGHGLKGSSEHADDISGWIKDVVSPAAHEWAKGAHEKMPEKSEEALYEQFMQRIMPNRNVAKLGLMFSDPGFIDQILKDTGLVEVIMALKEAFQQGMGKGLEGVGSPTMVEEGFHKQWESMMAAIGSPIMKDAIPVMKAATDLFSSIGSWANANPDTVQRAAEAIATISVGMIGIGTALAGGALIAAMGPAGWFIAALTGLSVAFPGARDAMLSFLAALTSGQWDKIKPAGENLGHEIIMAIIKAVTHEIRGFWAIGVAIMDSLRDGIMSGLDNLKSRIQALLDSINIFSPSRGSSTPFHDRLPQGSFFGRGSPTPQVAPNFGLTPHDFVPMNFNSSGQSPLLQNANWSPAKGGGNNTIQVHNVINLDGSAIARAINDYSVNDMEHPKQAGYFDGRENFSSQDSQITTT